MLNALQFPILVLGPQHSRGSFHRPREAALGPVGNPERRQCHERGIAGEHVGLLGFQRIRLPNDVYTDTVRCLAPC